MTRTDMQHLTREELETEVTMLNMLLRRSCEERTHWQHMVMEHGKLNATLLYQLEQANREVENLKLALEAKIRLTKIEVGP